MTEAERAYQQDTEHMESILDWWPPLRTVVFDGVSYTPETAWQILRQQPDAHERLQRGADWITNELLTLAGAQTWIQLMTQEVDLTDAELFVALHDQQDIP